MDLEPISADVNHSGCSAIRSIGQPRTGSSPSGVLTPPDPVPVHGQPFCPASQLVRGSVRPAQSGLIYETVTDLVYLPAAT
jgi:hypothetical protein